jgi:hypothetical protein
MAKNILIPGHATAAMVSFGDKMLDAQPLARFSGIILVWFHFICSVPRAPMTKKNLLIAICLGF